MHAPPSLRTAWHEALYGPAGFYRRESPAAHFRTSVHASAAFARALGRLVDEYGRGTVVDLGAGRGELLTHLHREHGDRLRLVGVEVAGRPDDLHPQIEWSRELPAAFDGLLVANEYLDNVPCEVVEVDDHGTVRRVCADVASGAESLGEPVDDPWLEAWWPLREPGERAEIGAARDQAWADAVARVRNGLAVAVDYGHLAGDRPAFGSLRSYADGREVDVRLDGTRDVTAHVAVDSVAAGVGGTLRRQSEMLAALGVDGTRPPLELATTNPGAYVRALSAASQAAELTARGGLGDFWWILAER